MEEKLYYQTIEIDGYGTTDIMKWLQANHQLALKMYFTILRMRNFTYICSLMARNVTIEEYSQNQVISCIEVNGVRKYYDDMLDCWLIELNGDVYLLDCYFEM